MLPIQSPYEKFGARPLAFFQNPDSYEINQLALTEEQSIKLTNALMDIISNNYPFAGQDGFTITLDDKVIVSHKEGKEIKEFYSEEEINGLSDES